MNITGNTIDFGGFTLVLTDEQLAELRSLLCTKETSRPTAVIGETVTVADIEWIVLDKAEEGVLCLAKNSVAIMKFDDSMNNYAGSYIRKWLNGKFLNKIGSENIIEHTIDLTANDGLEDYGNVTDKVGLLTCDQYRKYNGIIRKYPVDNWWWTATAWSTPSGASRRTVCCVDRNGSLNYDNVIYSYWVRPFCIFPSSIFES